MLKTSTSKFKNSPSPAFPGPPPHPYCLHEVMETIFKKSYCCIKTNLLHFPKWYFICSNSLIICKKIKTWTAITKWTWKWNDKNKIEYIFYVDSPPTPFFVVVESKCISSVTMKLTASTWWVDEYSNSLLTNKCTKWFPGRMYNSICYLEVSVRYISLLTFFCVLPGILSFIYEWAIIALNLKIRIRKVQKTYSFSLIIK